MDLDGLLLARIQFGFTIASHIIFPTFTIGLSAYIATLEGIWLKTRNPRLQQLARFWTKVFAVSFAMGVVSGIVMSYQFGTNWSRFSEVVGNVVGPLIGYEVLTAFFLEATFLAVMLFGWNRVPPWLHFLSSAIVALGTCISAFWILSANSWMQAPTGHQVVNGIAYPVDWWAVVFNPTFPLRLAHMVIAAYLTTAFVILSVAARWLRRGIHTEDARLMLRMALAMVIVLAPAQLLIGDLHGLKTRDYQPAKIAAIEAHWDGAEPASFVMFAWPDPKNERNRFELAIPKLGSLIITHELDGRFKGLKDFLPENRPPVHVPFFAFRLMAGIGMLMLAMAASGAWLWWRGRVETTAWYLRAASMMWPAGFVAVIAGWLVAEVGRQPWIATGILRTADAASPVPAAAVLTSLVLFVLVYAVVFSIGIYYINRLLEHGPQPHAHHPAPQPAIAYVPGEEARA